MNDRTLVNIPTCAWSRAIGLDWEKPYTVRYTSNLDDGAFHGMPLGGFGAGCMGRSHQGDFNLWHIDGGEHVFRSIPACQFSVFEQTGTQTQTYALNTKVPADGTLSTWNWYPASSSEQQTGTYHALYPRSWFVYKNVFQANLICEQFSPIWAHNYQETSYPVAVFQWTAHNPTDRPIHLSILLTWQNLSGWFTNVLKSPAVQLRDDGSPFYDYQPKWGESRDNFNSLLIGREHIAIMMDRSDRPDHVMEGDGQWAIATTTKSQVEVFRHAGWNPDGDGADLWQTFAQDGSLRTVEATKPMAEGKQVGAAIAVRFTLQPGETRQIPFTVAWDFPVTEFAQGVEYFRRYTDFFGRNGRNATTIAYTALENAATWREQIQSWQQPILDQDLPNWFKMALFNELYNLTDGGTLWSAADQRDRVGQFAVLECLDYRWYESLDVRLYGSFALLQLFPELEKSVIRAFARAIPTADPTPRVIGYYYTQNQESPIAQRKIARATPHDLGAPNEHPWEQTNYTSYQDCNLWKDLPSDFVLQVYRDYWHTGATDVAFLAECWQAIVQTLTYLKTFDLDQDGIPENSGAPDQTFDDWKLQGVSAYCGSLWLAALEAAIAIGNILLDHPTIELTESPAAFIQQCQSWLAQAQPIYQSKLWNGQYYRLDSDSGSDVVMADQLCGQFYARLLDLPDLVPEACVRSTLQTVYQSCFVKFNQWVMAKFDGAAAIGAANGVRPDGSPEDPNATHPLEVWTGINFGLAAFLVQMGMKEEAWQLTQAVVLQIYTNGLQFRTPEAITANGTFRASHYLRAPAIWAIYQQLQN
jgi:non-lysosomal glucosylceramidase